MTFLKNNWKIIVLLIAVAILAVFITRSCTKQPISTAGTSIDSLKTANINLVKVSEHLSDSITKVIAEDEKVKSTLSSKLVAITEKYRILINRNPEHDTVVKTTEVYVGKECLEKMPIMEAQLLNCQNENDSFKGLVKVKDTEIYGLQGQLDRSISLNTQQDKENKQLRRKNNRKKVGLIITGTAAVIGLGYALFK